MIKIDELYIRSHGQNEEEGRNLGKKLSERLSDITPIAQGDVHIPEIKVQFQSASTDGTEQTVDRITEQVLRQINLETSFL